MNGSPDVALVRLLGRDVRGLVIHERAERAARVDVRQRDVRNGARLLVQRVEVVLHGTSAKQHYHVVLARAGSVLVVRHPGVAAIRQNSKEKERRQLRVATFASGSIATSPTQIRRANGFPYALPLSPPLLFSTLLDYII